ncbi:MAG: tRNA (adenosine(37)-N6)-dimethylallyltransferase MiaA [Syntrophorhabdaceae bacterium]|nr:tRNA (adenosine(37)-N6)-dimethylallyltransferase MiaA [Syntrophorhabdaceae bacterium]
MNYPRIVILSGPTASGKTKIALELAQTFGMEIVNADSMQVYRRFDIGTAKPTPEERGKVPHHIIDVADPDEHYNAGRYVEEAEAAIADIASRGKTPLVVGGSGMYLRALLRGLDPMPSDPAVRAALDRRWEEEGGAVLYAELTRIDPASALKIHCADRLRVIRALEIAEVGGIPAGLARSSWSGAGKKRESLFLVLWPDRGKLYRNIDARSEKMFQSGLIDEVRGLLESGCDRELKPMQSLGYRQAAAHLLDAFPLAEALESTKRDTRRYAKRQLTWFSAESEAVRLLHEAEPVREAARLVNMFLFQ